MKNTNRKSKLKAVIVSFFTLTIIFTGWSADPINAQESNNITVAYFGVVGVAPGQTARLNVANAHFETSDSYPPDPVIEMRLVDRNGNVVNRNRIQLRAGRTANIRVDNVFRRRVDLRALVLINHPPMARFSPKLIIPTFEIINNDTGISSAFIHPASIIGFNPQPEPPGQ